MNQKEKEYRIKIPGKSGNLEVIRNFVSDIAFRIGFDKKSVHEIELAVDEACTNIIEHAYEYDESKDIDVLVKTDLKQLAVIISDKGKSFNHKDVKMPDMQEYMKELRVGGLGIYLMKTLMDEVNYHTGKGVNKVHMVKYLKDSNI